MKSSFIQPSKTLLSQFTVKTPIKPQERTMSCTKMRQNKLEGVQYSHVKRLFFSFWRFFVIIDVAIYVFDTVHYVETIHIEYLEIFSEI